nr:MAG TPA: hypothetical protein [Caudoviricetes sp.]
MLVFYSRPFGVGLFLYREVLPSYRKGGNRSLTLSQDR